MRSHAPRVRTHTRANILNKSFQFGAGTSECRSPPPPNRPLSRQPLRSARPNQAQPISARDMFCAHNMCYNLYLMGIIMFTMRARIQNAKHPKMQSFLKLDRSVLLCTHVCVCVYVCGSFGAFSSIYSGSLAHVDADTRRAPQFGGAICITKAHGR